MPNHRLQPVRLGTATACSENLRDWVKDPATDMLRAAGAKRTGKQNETGTTVAMPHP